MGLFTLWRRWERSIARLNTWFDGTKLGRYFQVLERDTTLTTEIRAGTVTFLTMAYILSVNANILADSGGPCTEASCTGPNKSFSCRFTDPGFRACVDAVRINILAATAASSLFGCLVMGIAANLPFALAPSMGINAYFTYTVVGYLGTGAISYSVALGAVFIEGALFILLSVTGVRQSLVSLMPRSLLLGMASGIGLFLAMVGMQGSQGIGLVTGDTTNLVALGGCDYDQRAHLYAISDEDIPNVCKPDPLTGAFPDLGHPGKNWVCTQKLTSPTMWLGLGGLAIMAILLSRHVKGAVIIGIAVTTIIAWIPGTGVSFLGHGSHQTGGVSPTGDSRWTFFKKVVMVPRLDKTGLALKFRRQDIASHEFWIALFTFLYVDFFDASGSLFSMANFINQYVPNFLDEHKMFKGSLWAYTTDGLSIMVGALMGTSPVTVYIESSTGIREGGRTGITAITVACWFFVSLWFTPILASIPVYSTGPAVIMVGSLMMVNVARIDWVDMKEAIPAFLTMLIMPFTYSIAYGVIGGIGAYIIMWVANKILDWLDAKWRQITTAPPLDATLGASPLGDSSANKPTGTLVDAEDSMQYDEHSSQRFMPFATSMRSPREQ